MEVEKVIRLPSTSIMLKLRLKSSAMATRAVGEGLAICHQYMRPKYVERETYVKVTPCSNCFAYDHLTDDCPEDKVNRCTRCSQVGHFCKRCMVPDTDIKCKSCNGSHRTFLAACPIRKKYIKDGGAEIRKK